MSNNDPNPKSPTETSNDGDFPTLRIRMISLMLRLEAHLDFSLSAMDKTGVLWILRFTVDPNVRSFAVPPIVFLDGYSLVTPFSTWLHIGLTEGVDPPILMIVHPTARSYLRTANLLAPLIVNPDTMSALQVVFEDQG